MAKRLIQRKFLTFQVLIHHIKSGSRAICESETDRKWTPFGPDLNDSFAIGPKIFASGNHPPTIRPKPRPKLRRRRAQTEFDFSLPAHSAG
jgi:hypothetical protein